MTTSNFDALTIKSEEETTLVNSESEKTFAGSEQIEPSSPSFANSFIVFWICSTLILSTLAFGTVHTWALSLFYCCAVVVVLFWIIDAWRTNGLRFNNSLLQLPLLGVLFVGLIQLLPLGGTHLQEGTLSIPYVQSLTQDPYATRMALVQIASIAIFFAASLAFFDSQSRILNVTRIIIIFGFLLAVFGSIQKFSSPDKIYWLREPQQAFPFGPFINSGHFAACMEMTLSLTLGVLFSGGVEKDQRMLYGFMAAVMFVAMIMTGSRGAFIVSFVIVVTLLVARTFLHRKQREGEEEKRHRFRSTLFRLAASMGVGGIVTIAILLVVFTLGGSAAINRIFNYTDANHPSGGGRAHYWSGALEIIKDNPLIGVGLEGFGVAYTKYDTLDGTYRIERAHNDYLQVMTDTGFIGAFFALAFILLLFRYGLACYKSARDKLRRGICLGALVGCYSVLLHSFFEFPLRTTSNAFLFLILAALATVEVLDEKSHVRLHRKKRKVLNKSETNIKELTS